MKYNEFYYVLLIILLSANVYSQRYSIPILSRQSQLDSFHLLYPGCKEILGNLHIVGSDISDVNSLSNIEVVTGDLLIKNTKIDSLWGLDKLRTAKSFRMLNNDSLSFINSFGLIQKIPDSLVIGDCPKLINLNSWNTIEEVGWFILRGNFSSMSSLIGLDKLRKANSFHIYNTKGIRSIEGFDSLTLNSIGFGNNLNLRMINGFKNVQYSFPCEQSIGDLWSGLELLFTQNDSLTYINGFHNTTCIGSILVFYNKLLDTLHVCGNTKYLGDLRLEGNDNLRSYHAFNSIERLTLAGFYLFDTHSKISDLQIFKRLKYAPYVNISSMAIKSLNGSFGMLDSIYTRLNNDKGELFIFGNPFLTDISALENLKYVKEIFIYGNKKLGECSIKSVCDHLDLERTLKVDINNFPGCRSINQIKTKCVTSMDEELNTNFHLFPNPTDGDLNITLSEYVPADATVSIYDMMGNKVLENRIFYGQNNISFSAKQAGFYIYKIIENGVLVFSGKIVKVGR